VNVKLKASAQIYCNRAACVIAASSRDKGVVKSQG